MNSLKRLVRAPSNIALIKYMGKTDAGANLPENSSLSMTLDALSTWVAFERTPSAKGSSGGSSQILLLPELPAGIAGIASGVLRLPHLSAAGRAKVIRHVERVKTAASEILPAFGLRAHTEFDLVLRSANTFPEASGIASSASSFAAITLATALACAADTEAFERAWSTQVELKRAFARVSRQGSGSSCRSFEGPWVLWEGEGAHAVEATLPELSHFVILISEETKTVSSSEAHLRVKTSPLWSGRPERVERRLEKLRAALSQGDLATIARLSWTEAWEMHSLFHTSEEPFSYWKAGTIDALHWFAPMILTQPIPPIVTLDAGPNIHVIVPRTEADAWRANLHGRFGVSALLEDRPGSGAQVVSS